MTSKKSLKICRLLVAVLLFNMAVPVIQAAEAGQEGYTLLCTSAGLIKVSLDGENFEPKSNQIPTGDHCQYCKLVDLPLNLSSDHLSYPVPDSNQALSDQNKLAPPASQHILEYVQLRAPPIYI